MRPGVSRLEVEASTQPPRQRRLQRVVSRKPDVARIARAAFARQADDRMTKFFVVHRVRRDAVAHTVDVADSDGTCRSRHGRQVRIPNTQTADEVRAYIPKLKRPALVQIALHRQV